MFANLVRSNENGTSVKEGSPSTMCLASVQVCANTHRKCRSALAKYLKLENKKTVSIKPTLTSTSDTYNRFYNDAAVGSLQGFFV